MAENTPQPSTPVKVVGVFTGGLGVLLVMVALSGCSSVSVKEMGGMAGSGGVSKPTHIYVAPFGVEKAQAKESFARKEKGRLKIEASRMLAKELAAQISKELVPATVVANNQERIPARVWRISGEITRVEEGSRFLRMGFGLGMGGTKLETSVQVRADSGPVFLRFATTGGSGAVPGAATNPAPFSSLPTALLHTREGISDDVQRTARMITARIGQVMVQRGWVAPEAVGEPKMWRP